MPIPTTLESLSTTAASNGPAGSEQRTLTDDGLRQAYAFDRQIVSEGAQIASATTITPPSNGYQFDITGVTTITTIASTNSWNGRRVLFIFTNALILSHSANLALPGSSNITTAVGDTCEFVQTGSGAWRCVWYTRAANYPPVEGTYTPTLTNTTNVFASTAQTTYYTRIGNQVSVWGTVTIDPTASATLTVLGISLPVTSALASFRQLAGTAARTDGADYGIVTGNAVDDIASLRFTPTSAASDDWSFHFSYVLV